MVHQKPPSFLRGFIVRCKGENPYDSREEHWLRSFAESSLLRVSAKFLTAHNYELKSNTPDLRSFYV